MNYEQAWKKLKASLELSLLLSGFGFFVSGSRDSDAVKMARAVLEAMGESEKLIDKEAVEDEKD